MIYFVEKDSIVRQIWGNSDIILFIFAGAAAEFALSKAVDWLYFTGRLPSDPLGRLFSTVSYARAIVFSEKQTALGAIDKIAAIHKGVELKRGAKIPDWAYRDVLFMLIDYSIRSFELLERPLTILEKEEVFDVFYRVGDRMGINELPHTFDQWIVMRREHVDQNLEYGPYSEDLFQQYRKHLGFVRYRILLGGQAVIVPKRVLKFLGYRRVPFLKPLIPIYKLFRKIQVDRILKNILLPAKYKKEFETLDSLPT